MSTETEALREQFEAWARKNELEAERHKYADDQYDDHAATSAWWAWRDAYQAGYAAARAQTADVGEPCIVQPLFTAPQLAEAQKDAERWRRAAQCTRLDQFGGFVVTPDEPAFASEVSLAFTREIDAAIDAAKGESNA